MTNYATINLITRFIVDCKLLEIIKDVYKVISSSSSSSTYIYVKYMYIVHISINKQTKHFMSLAKKNNKKKIKK